MNVRKMQVQEVLKILKERFPDRRFEIIETVNKMKMLVQEGTFLAWIINGDIEPTTVQMLMENANFYGSRNR